MTETEKPSKIRYRVLAFIFVNVVINYMDRSNISVAAASISRDLKFTPIEMGLIFSAFGWTYAALQIPGGILVDRFGPRIVYAISLISWSLATFFQGFARGFIGLFSMRLATGAFEAPAFPANNRVVTSWFPDNERASAIATYTSGQFIGLAFLTPVLAVIEYYAGWRGLFFITGAVGIIWGIIWYRFYRDPAKHSSVNNAELTLIEEGGGLTNREKDGGTITQPDKFKLSNLKEVLSHRKLWGIYLGQFAVNSTLWFFLTWFPTYLVQYRHMDFLKSGFLASAPFLAAFAGVLSSGFLSDYLIKRGISVNLARKAPVITGLLLSTAIIGANYVDSTAWIIFFMALAFFGNGFASITWVFVSTLAPKNLVGLTGGVFNFIGGLASIIVPIVIGFLAQDGSFEPALMFIATLGLCGALSYIFLVGKVERIQVR